MMETEQAPPGDLDRLRARVGGQIELGVQIVEWDWRTRGHEVLASQTPASSASTSSIESVDRSPVARDVTSTPPAASERGLTVRIQGIPSSSASVNLTPGDSSRSSHRISRPEAIEKAWIRSAASSTFGSRTDPIDTR